MRICVIALCSYTKKKELLVSHTMTEQRGPGYLVNRNKIYLGFLLLSWCTGLSYGSQHHPLLSFVVSKGPRFIYLIITKLKTSTRWQSAL